MRNASRIFALLLATAFVFSLPQIGHSQGICSLLGLCGRGSDCGGGCGCGCEPSCGCAGGCGVDGRQFGGQAWDGCGCEGGMTSCGSANSCGSGCGCANSCGPSCGSEATCGCEPSCGCSSNCNRNNCCLCEGLFKSLFGCNGCNDEVYWCEWRNDPPRCCEPCDRYGNWIGPSAGYRAPYSHEYAVGGPMPSSQYANSRNMQKAPAYAANSAKAPAGLPTAKRSIATQTTRPMAPTATPSPLARRPVPTTNRSYQR